jgi:hypothetical protein
LGERSDAPRGHASAGGDLLAKAILDADRAEAGLVGSTFDEFMLMGARSENEAFSEVHTEPPRSYLL